MMRCFVNDAALTASALLTQRRIVAGANEGDLDCPAASLPAGLTDW
jgi:hypothetical protein